MIHRFVSCTALFAACVVAIPARAQQQTCPATTPGATMPLTYKGGPTVPAITPCDLMTRLYIYAADSMGGREAGSPEAMRATAWIEREVRKIGLEPAGDNGTFFQNMPVTARSMDPSGSIVSGSTTFHVDKDFATQIADRNVTGDVYYVGALDCSINPADVEGKIVIRLADPAGRGAAGGRGGFGGGGGGPAALLSGAAAIITVSDRITPSRPSYNLLDTVQADGKAEYARTHPATGRGGRGGGGGGGGGGGRGRGAGRGTNDCAPPAGAADAAAGGAGGGRGAGGGGGGALAITAKAAVANALLGKSVAGATRGDKGPSATITVKARVEPSPTRNVVGIIRGTDPVLRNQYIVIGAHSDHVGFARSATVEHDSLKAYNMVAAPSGLDAPRPPAGNGYPPVTPEMWTRINFLKDSLRKIYPARMDSITNGADDDGSGSVSILEIAEAFAKGPVKTKRSLLFIWQMGEEKGLWGSQYWTNHPTVPRDSIVADLNMDMVGRGAPTDETGRAIDRDLQQRTDSIVDRVSMHGAVNYVQLVGPGRLSSELGTIAQDVNKAQAIPFTLDYDLDADKHPMNIYCRSDHANYARYNIPVIFFTTGGHSDYHQMTDEPEYIRYEHMSRVDKYVFDVAVKVGNLDHRVVVDKTKFDSPFGTCQQ